jgi:hypothetical protein
VTPACWFAPLLRKPAKAELLAGLLGLGVALASGTADAADLRPIAARVADEWRTAGATVVRSPPHFLSEDETITVRLPPDGASAPCTTVALIGARGMSFQARVPHENARDEYTSSVAGVLEISRCVQGSAASAKRGGRGASEPFDRLSVTSEAGRGAFETVIARSRASLAPLRTILLERTGGVLPPPPEPGGLPPLPSPEARADIAEARARREGGKLAPRDSWGAGAEGAGEGRVQLEAGCHRIELFAVDPRTAHASRRFRLDLDAELRDEDGEPLARDRTDAPDARLDTCVGDGTAATVVFAGSPPGAGILVTHLSWPIPERLPLTWGRDTRARMAQAMLARHVGAPRAAAIFLAQGASGLTPVPVDVEPGACYVGVVALEHGHTRGLGLRAMIGARYAADERGTTDDAALVSFCAHDRERAHLEVDARGAGVAWALAVFRLESSAWETGP